MTTALKQIADDLMKLPVAERIELADALYHSAAEVTAADVERAWAEEIGKRLDDYEAGRSIPIPARRYTQ